jgi:PKD repeat protein
MKPRPGLKSILLLLPFLSLLAGCIIPNEPPVAVIDASCLTGRAPVRISFDAYDSFDPDGTVDRCHWSFGDGQVDDGKWVSHMYYTPGTYTVTLTVWDDDGASGSVSVNIVVLEGPVASDFQVTNVEWEPGLCWLIFTFPCIHVYTTVKNNGPYPARVELAATAYNASGAIVGQTTFWSYSCDIPPGQSFVVDGDMISISGPMESVSRIVVVIASVKACN